VPEAIDGFIKTVATKAGKDIGKALNEFLQTEAGFTKANDGQP
jgi:predicted hydrocarbon binding protein